MTTDINRRSTSGPRDVFLHILAIITLYTSAVSFTALIFQYINVLLPDPLERDAYYLLQSYYRSIRWSISALSVVFPTYLATSWYLNKLYAASPEKRNLRIRKWLLYFTLFAASLIIVGDLVTLIYNFLGGELTARFLLKIFTVFFVAGSIFGYYFWDLRKSGDE
jgi:hypothetical protein